MQQQKSSLIDRETYDKLAFLDRGGIGEWLEGDFRLCLFKRRKGCGNEVSLRRTHTHLDWIRGN